MRADYRCPCGAIGEVQHPPQVAVFVSHCPGQMAVRYFSPENVFQHQEDRRHMRGEGRSSVTGLPMAQSRSEERVIERERGIYFTTKTDMTPQERTLREHAQYVKEGGTPVKPEVLNPPPDPRVAPGTIMRKVREKGIKLKP